MTDWWIPLLNYENGACSVVFYSTQDVLCSTYQCEYIRLRRIVVNCSVCAGYFLQHQELPHLPALHCCGSTIDRRAGYVHGVQMPNQRNAGTAQGTAVHFWRGCV